MAKKNIFGQSLWIKKRVFQVMGLLTRNRFMGFNNFQFSGGEVLARLPDRNVLFIANHETIFADVSAMYHIFFSVLAGQVDTLKKKYYLKEPKLNVYYVAARETMEKGFLPKILAMAGAVSVDRTWRKGEEMIQRAHNPDDTAQIGEAIKDGWVVTFPQGTTRTEAPVRKGTAHIIRQYKPLVVPVRIDGFREAFDKTGMKVLKKGVDLSVRFSEPLAIDYENDTIEDLVKKIGVAIGEDHTEPSLQG